MFTNAPAIRVLAMSPSARIRQGRYPTWQDMAPIHRSAHTVICAALRQDVAGVARACASLRTDRDWEALLSLAKRRQVAPLLLRPLRSSGIQVPPAVMDACRSSYQLVAAYTVNLEAGLTKVLQLFESRVIEVILLKGAARLVDPAWRIEGRPMADLDLLVREVDVERVGHVLDELGYPPQLGLTHNSWEMGTNRHHMDPRVGQSGLTPVEVHWGVTSEPHAFAVEVEAFWRRTRPRPDGGYGLLLAPEAHLLHTCLHACANHVFEGGTAWLADLHHLVTANTRPLDWGELRNLAKAFEVTSAVYWPLYIAASDLGTPVDRSGLTALRPGVVRRVAGRFLLKHLGVLGPTAAVPGRTRLGRAFFKQVLVDRPLSPRYRLGLFVGDLLPAFRPIERNQGAWAGFVRGVRHYLSRLSPFGRSSRRRPAL